MKRSLRSWIWRVPLEQEVDEELGFHLEMRARDLEARGMSATDARAAAAAASGHLPTVRNACIAVGRKRDHEMRITRWIEDLRDDVKFAVRQLLGSPGFTLVAAFTLALGIGATTSIFSVVHAVVLRPLPFAESDRLVVVGENFRDLGRPSASSAGNFGDWQTHSRSFRALGALQRFNFNLTDNDNPERVVGGRVTSTWFDVYAAAPLLGRTFSRTEDAPGQPGVAVLSHRLWTRRFGADPATLGQSIRLNGAPHTVIGVMSPFFDVLADAEELWVPIAFTPEQLINHDEHYLAVIARLAPGVSIAQANVELKTIHQRMVQQYPNDGQVRVGLAAPLQGELVGDFRQRLLVLMGAVSLVLLIACGNVANLLLARGGARAGELAVRTAIGAGRGRIVRQLLTEAIVLAAAGAAMGMGIAWAAVPAFVAFSPGGVPRLEQAAVDGVVMAFAVGATVLSALVAGLAPAVRAAATDLRGTLVDGGRAGTGRRDRVRTLLVASEVALALMLLVGAGLLVRSALYLQRVDPGFDTGGVLTARVTLPAARYPETPQTIRAFENMLAAVSESPAVEVAALSSRAPMTPGGNTNGLMPGNTPFDDKTVVDTSLHVVTLDYFRALRIPLKRGRLFTNDDREGAPRITVLNETAARALFPGEDPIGKVVGCCEFAPDRRLRTVVGIVGDTRSLGPAALARLEFFLPVHQAPPDAWRWFGRTMTVVARGRTADPEQLISVVRAAMRRVDPAVPLYEVRTMEQRLQRSVAPARFNTLLMLLLGTTGLVLAAVGIYGVLSYSVTERRREIGIRMALGATGSNVIRMIVRQGMQPVGLGIAIGIAAALATSRVMSAYVAGITTTDPLTFAAVVAVMIAVALIASAFPAWRAVRTEPTRALNRV